MGIPGGTKVFKSALYMYSCLARNLPNAIFLVFYDTFASERTVCWDTVFLFYFYFLPATLTATVSIVKEEVWSQLRFTPSILSTDVYYSIPFFSI